MIASIITCIIGSADALGKYNPCSTPGLATRVRPQSVLFQITCIDLLIMQNDCASQSDILSLLLQGRGFYVGVAFWPGGRVEDWLPVYDSDTQQFGLNPCNTTNHYNNTALSDSRYLARPLTPCLACLLPLHGSGVHRIA